MIKLNFLSKAKDKDAPISAITGGPGNATAPSHGVVHGGFDTAPLVNALLNFIVPLVSLGLSALLIFFIVYPYFKNTPLQTAEVEANKTLRALLTEKKDNLNKLVSYKSAVTENMAMINKSYVNEPEEPKLLDEVNQLVYESGLSITSLATSGGIGEESADGSKSVFITLGVEGNMNQVLLFLQKVENASRVLRVDSFRYSSQKTENPGLLGVSASLSSPYFNVASAQNVDEPIRPVLFEKEYLDLVARIKGMTQYEFSNRPLPVAVEQIPAPTAAPTAAPAAAPAEVVEGAKTKK